MHDDHVSADPVLELDWAPLGHDQSLPQDDDAIAGFCLYCDPQAELSLVTDTSKNFAQMVRSLVT